MMPPMTRTATAMSHDSPMSSRSAMIRPPIIMMGAWTIMKAVIMTSCWTCWTSLVVRVMSEGAPNWLTSRELKLSTRSKIAARMSRPNPMAVLAPK